MGNLGSGSNRIQIRILPDLDPDKPDLDPVWPELDPVWPELDPAMSGSGSSLPGSRSGNIRIWIRLVPDLDTVAARSKVPHGLSVPVQALPQTQLSKKSMHVKQVKKIAIIQILH